MNSNTRTSQALREETERIAQQTRQELTHRLLVEAGRRSADAWPDLDSTVRTGPITSHELAYAVMSTDPELNSAVEAWFNRNRMFGSPVNTEHIRRLMSTE